MVAVCFFIQVEIVHELMYLFVTSNGSMNQSPFAHRIRQSIRSRPSLDILHESKRISTIVQ